VLLRLLEEDDQPAVLSSAAVGLGHLHDDRAIERLAALAPHPDAQVRRGVVHGLMGHDDDRAVAALIGLSQDPDPSVRDWATFSLGVQTDRDTPEVREALAARLGEPDPEDRGDAILGLARRGDSRALAAALDAAPQSNEHWRPVNQAIVVLGAATGDRRLRDHLERLRADPEAAVAFGAELERAIARCAEDGRPE
jgi:HEAT repeat protein